MQLKIEVGNVTCAIIGDIPAVVRRALYDELAFELPGSFFMRRRNPHFDGFHRLLTKANTFPTGLISKVLDTLAVLSVQVYVEDKRQAPALGRGVELDKSIQLRPYQEEAVEVALAKQRGIIRMATGGGKSLVMAAIMGRLDVRTIVLIHRKDIFYQLVASFKKALNMPIGEVGCGKIDVQNVTVCMTQSLISAFDEKEKDAGEGDVLTSENDKARVRALVKECELLICDEGHHLSAPTLWAIVKKAEKAYYKYAVSATPWREDNAILLIEAATAPQFFDASASKLIDAGYLMRPKIYFVSYKHDVKTNDARRYPAIYDERVVNNLERNALVAQLALKSYAAGRTTLIAVTKIEHGVALEKELRRIVPDAVFIHGSSDNALRRDVVDELISRKRRLVVASTIFGEGLDIPSLDTLINAKAQTSSIDAIQLLGRILRKAPGKTTAVAVDVADVKCKYLAEHSRARRSIYASEPAFELVDANAVDDVTF